MNAAGVSPRALRSMAARTAEVRHATRAAARIVLVLVALMLALFAASIASAAPPPVTQPPMVLIVQHSYSGPIVQAGVLARWQFTGGYMLVEWIDTTADGIYRNGFEVQE